MQLVEVFRIILRIISITENEITTTENFLDIFPEFDKDSF